LSARRICSARMLSGRSLLTPL